MLDSMRNGLASPRAMFLVSVSGLSVGLIALAAIRTPVQATTSHTQPADFMATMTDVMGITKGDVVNLDVDPMPGMHMLLDVPVAGEMLTLELTPHSSRAPDYRISIQIEDGSLIDVEPGPVNTMRGHVLGMPDSIIAANLAEDGLHASIFLPDGKNYWVEPLSGRVAGAEANQYVVYNADDTTCEGICGATMMRQEGFDGGMVQMDVGTGTVCKVAGLAIDADFQYYQARGSSVTNVENRINAIVDTLNVQYESQVGIRHNINHIIVRTSSGANPYTTNNASNLLTQFRNHWNSNHWSIQRATTHLFTGRNLGSTLGIAYLGVVCNSQNRYGLSVNYNNFSCATDLTAHELGHNWSSDHCSCPGFTMNPSITCANNFSTGSRNAIISHRNSRSCLGDCPPPGPANNTCTETIMLGQGEHPFDTRSATTTGPPEPNDCTFFGDGDIQNDIWFGHIAECDGILTVNACQSPYTAKLALYGSNCPTSPGTVLACDVNSCPNNRATVSIPVSQGEFFRIRIGGHNGSTGTGILSITCGPASNCPADLTGSGNVAVADLLVMLAAWGPCGGCDEDLNGDGEVNVADMLELLAAWGSCP